MKVSRLAKLRIAKYSINVGLYVGLAVAGVFVSLPEGSPLYSIQQSSGLAINTNVILPIIFCLFGLVAVLKDQFASYFKLPKGVGAAVVLFLLGFLGWLVSYWLMVITGAYLFLTLINCLYFNPAIDIETEARKTASIEEKKKRLRK